MTVNTSLTKCNCILLLVECSSVESQLAKFAYYHYHANANIICVVHAVQLSIGWMWIGQLSVDWLSWSSVGPSICMGRALLLKELVNLWFLGANQFVHKSDTMLHVGSNNVNEWSRPSTVLGAEQTALLWWVMFIFYWKTLYQRRGKCCMSREIHHWFPNG